MLDLDEITEDIGLGRFQLLQQLLVSGVRLADGAEILISSAVLSILQQEWELSPALKGSMMSIIFIGVFFGNLMGGPAADAYGRRLAVLLAYARGLQACRIKKRSLKRAMRRADRDGKAAYHGGIIPRWTPPFEPAAPKPQIMPWTQTWDRLTVVQWNCGGLSQELQLEWYTWLRRDPSIGVFILVETHWSFTNDFQSEGWTLIHSGTSKKKGAGVLVGIRSDLIDQHSMKWNELEAGRLLHVRCHIRRQQYDILAIYQHALARVSGEEQAELMTRRRALWRKLDGAIAGFPFRSSLLIAGDFNMVFEPLAEVAGHGIRPGGDTEKLKAERAEVMEIFKARRLVVLNSWSKAAITYHHPNGSSQIDYILVRRQSADIESRKCAPVSTPLAGWRSAGHFPVVASIKANWKPWKQGITLPPERRDTAPTVEEIRAQLHPSLQGLQKAVKLHLEAPKKRVAMPKLREATRDVEAIWAATSGEQYANAEDAAGTAEAQAVRKREMRKLARQRKRDALLETLALVGEAQNARCDALAEHAKQLFAAPRYDPPELLPLPHEWFDAEDLAPTLQRIACEALCSERPYVPEFWTRVQLAWLPKPGYVEDHTARILNIADQELLGGLMLSIIDLSKAFDYLGYSEMHTALQDTGMPEEISRVLIHIHQQTTLHIEHGGYGREVKMQRGLRQGCGVAPMLYSCWTAKLCKEIDKQIQLRDHAGTLHASWTQSHMSIFADDKHCFWDIQSCYAFERALRQIRIVIDVISSSGMVINFQKSMAVLALKGTQAQQIIKRHTKQWNGDKCLVLRSEDNDIRIPIVPNLTYLGVVLNYGQFEQATAKYRCTQANVSFAQLKNVLRVNGVLNKAQRLRVYKACVWPSLLYGISAVGVTHAALRALQSTAAQHLRKILRVHEKGHTNNSILEQADLIPLQHIIQRLDKQAGTLKQDVSRHAELRCREERRLQQIIEQVQILQAHGPTQALTQADTGSIAQIPCPVCGVYFGTAEGQSIDQLLEEIYQEELREPKSELIAANDLGKAATVSSLQIRTIAGMQQARQRTGTIKDFFGRRPVPHQVPPAAHRPWYCRLRLDNPSSLCYANAGVLLLVHGSSQLCNYPEELKFLRAVGRNAAERDVTLLLPRMHGLRKLAPQWEFGAEQKDAAELLRVMFTQLPDLQVVWDTRTNAEEGVRLRVQGALPIPLQLPMGRGPNKLQDLIHTWNQQDDSVTALTVQAPMICFQLGRYHMQAKNFNVVDLPTHVQVPVFQEDSSVQWCQYDIEGAIIHLGRTPTAGHYRALLKVEGLWWLTEDKKPAEHVNLHDGHCRNVYIIFLISKLAKREAQAQTFSSVPRAA
ncbi:pol [Symbiodinium sp. CCMP2456]|nr:pol [Symbiodinium sp. CCMP2456]